MKSVAVIPARGGSKGIRNKNMQTIGGKTLVRRAIDCCQRAVKVDDIFVSSEDNAIGEHAKRHGAKWIKRPDELAQDDTRIDPVLLHALDYISCDTLVLVQCTAPFMAADEIDRAINRQQESGADVTVVVARTDAFQVVIEDDYIAGVGFDINDPLTHRQSRPPCYEIAGSAWAINAAKFKIRGKLYSPRMNSVCCKRRFEIDDPWQLEQARFEIEAPPRYVGG